MTRTHFILLSLLFLFLYSGAPAKPAKPQCGREFGGPPPEKLEKKVDHHLLLRMSEEMSLTEEQLLKIGEVLRERREKTALLHAQMRKTLDTLSLLVKDESASQERIAQYVGVLKEQQAGLHQAEQAKIKRLEKLLPPRQLAQYFLLERDFRHQIMRMIRRDSGDRAHWRD